ncbi:hypothetical protein L1049_018274 [Liquidambar formosana]|uniref:Uncharacterized protein n=1 Tax=Liquidambar formosana TaxID=63359 RepID=A0AAP0R9U7_LIQFO
MGCAQSRIDNEEAVSRCKDRKIIMKEALVARNAFAAGHTGYAMALKNTGAALSDYGHGEAENPPSLHTHHNPNDDPLDPTSQPPIDNLPPPPPPLPEFSPSPLKRSATMPSRLASKPGLRNGSDTIMEDEDEVVGEHGGNDGDLRPRSRRNGVAQRAEQEAPLPPPSPPRTSPIAAVPPPPPDSKGGTWDYFFMGEYMTGASLSELEEIGVGKEEDEGEEFDGRDNVGGGGGGGGVGGEADGVEPKTPEKVVEKPEELLLKKAKQIDHSNTAPPEIRRASKMVPSVNLLKLLEQMDEFFLQASQSAQEVSKMLEANRLHYHSNFADNRGHIDHSARVMRVITWNRSFRGVPNGEGGRDDFDAEEQETHASVLDKLVAWEKKLYDEVKTSELMKLEYQKKVTLLNKQKKRGATSESLEKTKAAVSHLHTRYIVDMQSMDSTVSEVNHLRDYQLYPKLVALVDGMARMWESMCVHHDGQLKVAMDLKSLDIAHAPKETSRHHHNQTIQLYNVIQEWHSQFEKLVINQKKVHPSSS